MNIYNFSTYMSNLVMKRHLFCDVQKRKKHCSEKIFFKSHVDHWICLFNTEQHKCHFIMKFDKYVENMYMFVPKLFQKN